MDHLDSTLASMFLLISMLPSCLMMDLLTLDLTLDLMHFWIRLQSLLQELLLFTTQMEIVDSIQEDTSLSSPEGQDAAFLEDPVQDPPTIPNHPHVDHLEDQLPLEVVDTPGQWLDLCQDQASAHPPI